MVINKLPRGTIAARFTCLDLMSRANQEPFCTDVDVVNAVVLVTKYLMDPSFEVDPEDLTAYQQALEKLYC